eukprot:m.138333 g.138333  ORF g.138333 m.138333 type:complete len:372 (-) comp14775_c0_seq3:19-1134(-)
MMRANIRHVLLHNSFTGRLILKDFLQKQIRCVSSTVLTCSKKVRVGFLGAGDIATLHLEGIKKLNNTELVGIWSRPNCPIIPEPEQRAKEFGCSLFESAEALVSSPDIDAVFVLTNYETHLEYAKMAMKHGKHVLVEKPAAASCDEIEQLIACAKETGVKCMPVHNYVYEPSLLRVKDMITSGKLGDLHSIYIMYNIYHPEDICAKLPGVIKQIGTHHCYTALYLLNEDIPEHIHAFTSTLREGGVGTAPQENLAAITMQTKGGAVVHLQLSFASDDHSSDPWSFYVKVIGSRGSARYSYNDWVVNEKTLVHSHTYEPYPHTIAECDRHFIEEVVLGDGTPLSTLEDALVSQKILDAAADSAKSFQVLKIE